MAGHCAGSSSTKSWLGGSAGQLEANLANRILRESGSQQATLAACSEVIEESGMAQVSGQ